MCQETRTVKYRGELFTYTAHYYLCEASGERFTSTASDTDDMEQESALRNLKRMTGTKAKDDYEAFFFLGWGYFQVYNYPEAQQALTTAYNLMPKTEMAGTQMYSKLLYMLGVCYAQSNLPQGLEYFMALKDIAPYNTWPEYYANYAMLAYRLKLYNDAIIWFKLAHRADKTQPQPYFNIAVIYDTIYRNPKLARSYYVESLGNYQKQGNTLYVKKIVGRLKTLGK